LSNTVEIRGDDAVLRFDVEGYERSASQNADDANWLTCRCSVQLKGIAGHIRLSLTTYDFTRFYSDLQRALNAVSGEAKFTTYEDGVKLEINFRVTGTAEVRGVMRDGANSIAFSFDTDQTFLSQTESELQAVLQHFPVRK